MNSIKTFLESHKELHDFYNKIQGKLSDESTSIYFFMVLNHTVFFDEVNGFLGIDFPFLDDAISA
jgi:hypothetical protein